jgi:hypothetical protein
MGDRDQLRIDQEQVNQDGQREHLASTDHPPGRILDDRQARIDRAQASRDVSQEGLDHSQQRRDVQQHALDDARAMLKLPRSEQPDPPDAGTLLRVATERARAARERAEAALSRAHAALKRAEAAEVRARKEDPEEP